MASPGLYTFPLTTGSSLSHCGANNIDDPNRPLKKNLSDQGRGWPSAAVRNVKKHETSLCDILSEVPKGERQSAPRQK